MEQFLGMAQICLSLTDRCCFFKGVRWGGKCNGVIDCRDGAGGYVDEELEGLCDVLATVAVALRFVGNFLLCFRAYLCFVAPK